MPDAANLAIMRRLDRLHLEFPFAGSRMLQGLLGAEGHKIGRRHVKTLMKRMEIEALYRRPRTTKPEPGHKIYALGCEGIVSKRRGSLYRAGRSDNWLKRCAARRLRPSATLFSFQLFEPGERNG